MRLNAYDGSQHLLRCSQRCLGILAQAYGSTDHLLLYFGPDGRELYRSGVLEISNEQLLSLLSFGNQGVESISLVDCWALVSSLDGHQGHLILVLAREPEVQDLSLVSLASVALEHCLSTLTTRQQLKAAEQVAVVGDVTHRYAHEMKNVLAVIRGSIDLLDQILLQSGSVSVLRRTMRRLRAQARDLESLALTLLAVRRGDVDEDVLKRQRLDWLVKEVAGTAQVMSHSQGVELHVNASPAECRFNWRLMEQALLNILKNAVEASQEGQKIFVCVGPRPESGARIKVRDEGPGLPAELTERIFEPFFTTRARSGGTGLGLAVTRHVVEEVHGGHIHVCSRRGRGTTLVVEIPE